ncbi:unnamed protein product [Urochloa humidicola]
MELSGGDGKGAAKRARLSSGYAAAAASEDRLSALPDDVLALILLRLGTAAAARTSVLSRRWRRVWALLPELCIPAAPEPHRFRDTLDAHEVPLRSLSVWAGGAAPESMAIWLPAAARRVSGDLTLFNFDPGKDDDAEEAEAAQGAAFELPCFQKATSISLILGFHGLAMPPAADGVFARLTPRPVPRPVRARRRHVLAAVPVLAEAHRRRLPWAGQSHHQLGFSAANGAQEPARVVADQCRGAGAHGSHCHMLLSPR